MKTALIREKLTQLANSLADDDNAIDLDAVKRAYYKAVEADVKELDSDIEAALVKVIDQAKVFSHVTNTEDVEDEDVIYLGELIVDFVSMVTERRQIYNACKVVLDAIGGR